MFVFVVLFFGTYFSASAEGFEFAEKTYRVGTMPTVPPFSFLAKAGGTARLRGVSVDIMEMIGTIEHLNMKYLQCSDLAQRREWLLQGRVDIISLEHDSQMFEELGISFIPLSFALHRHLYVNKKCNTVVCAKDFSGKRVAVITGDYVQSFLSNVPEKDIVFTATPLEALKLLENGLTDVFIAPSEKTVRYIIQKEGFSSIKEVGLELGKIPLGLGIRKNDIILYKKLSDAIHYLHQNHKIDIIKKKWFGQTFQVIFIKKYAKLILAGGSIVSFSLFFIIVWNYQLKKRVRKITNDLKNSEKKYRGLIESSPDMIVLIDTKNIVVHSNAIGAKMFKKNHPFAARILKDDHESLQVFLLDIWKRSHGRKQFRFMANKGNVREMDVAASLIFSENNRPRFICCVARDVTERNRIENELVQADRLATIGKMAAGVAHEVNNPIGIVQANIDLILSHKLYTEESKEFLESAHRNAVRAGAITKDLLAIAKPKKPEMKEMNLNHIFRFTLSVLAPQLKSLTIKNTLCDVDRLVWGDSNLLQQVFVNILLNAKSAMQESKERKLKITSCAPPSEYMICLRIEDTGKGIPREKLQEIFEPFFTSGKREGFGLGLFISRRIIERHGGLIYAESEENKGTQVIIELPTLKKA